VTTTEMSPSERKKMVDFQSVKKWLTFRA